MNNQDPVMTADQYARHPRDLDTRLIGTRKTPCEATAKIQHGGTHYLDMPIQPWEVIDACDLDFYVGTAIAYLMRWQAKGGLLDVKKAIHTLQHFVEVQEAKNVGKDNLL